MKLAERTFNRKDYALTSKFGYRRIINTSSGATNSFHSGTDYGTHGNKWPQYPLKNGKVTSTYTDGFGAKCVVIDYSRIGKRLYYCHLDSICVKKGQAVNHDTILGYTGKTGKATGIHLHLGLKDIGGTTWLDPEKYDYKEGTKKETSTSILGPRGYIKLGDQSDGIAKIAAFMYKNFSLYTPKSALGNYYGPNIAKAIGEFQERCKAAGLYNDAIDQCIGPKTLKCLRHFGFSH